MTDVINLRQKRKAKARDDKGKQAAENRRIHGRTKAQKQLDKKEAERSKKHLDSHKLERDE